LIIDLFFFSSRRRHTRFSRDWSSDVCSSDLTKHRPQREWGINVRNIKARFRGNARDRHGDGMPLIVTRQWYWHFSADTGITAVCFDEETAGIAVVAYHFKIKYQVAISERTEILEAIVLDIESARADRGKVHFNHSTFHRVFYGGIDSDHLTTLLPDAKSWIAPFRSQTTHKNIHIFCDRLRWRYGFDIAIAPLTTILTDDANIVELHMRVAAHRLDDKGVFNV